MRGSRNAWSRRRAREDVGGGGAGNAADSTYAAVGGGSSNTASNYSSTVSGGFSNEASGDRATVGGGNNNTAGALMATVGGGSNNTASGSYATVPGGTQNEASGLRSFAAGINAHAVHTGTFVWASSSNVISSTGVNQFLIDASGGVGIGTNSPTNPLHMGSGAHVTAGGVWTNASSRELKTDIVPLENEEYSDILKKLEDLDVVHFKYKSEPDFEHIGMIAEDVPDEIASPDRTGIPTADAIAFLMAAVKAQQSKIEKLETKIEQLTKGK